MAEPKLSDLCVGDVLDNSYRLEQQIGEGGMGRVFLATDLKLERKVAVKALHAANLDTETMRRFDRETQVMGQLDHPSVVTLFAFGRTRGVPWLAMRLLDGTDLWTTLAAHGGRMGPQTLLPIVRQILPALGYLHGRGLLHRDLKPSNIHVGRTGKITLCDFGLARGHKSSLTRTGVIWGTPEYMAPEQILGERELDGRTDLYSLAVVMFRMLVGRPLFEDQNDQDVLRAHLSRPRPDVSRLVPSLSPMVGAAMQKGLAIRPEDRFQSAPEMLEAMELVLSLPLATAPRGQPSAPRPAPVPRAEGTRPVGKQRSGLGEPGTLPGLPALQDSGSGSSTFTDPDADSAPTNREGFTGLTPSVTPVDGNKNTQPNDAPSLSDGGGTVPDRPGLKALQKAAQPRVPDFEELATTPAPSGPSAPATPFMPVWMLITAAVLLFFLGLMVAKLLL